MQQAGILPGKLFQILLRMVLKGFVSRLTALLRYFKLIRVTGRLLSKRPASFAGLLFLRNLKS